MNVLHNCIHNHLQECKPPERDIAFLVRIKIGE